MIVCNFKFYDHDKILKISHLSKEIKLFNYNLLRFFGIFYLFEMIYEEGSSVRLFFIMEPIDFYLFTFTMCFLFIFSLGLFTTEYL